MSLLAWVWLVSSFVVIALIAHYVELRKFIAEHHGRCRAAGCLGAVMMFLGVALVPATLGKVVFALGPPLVGLLAWLRDDRNDGGEGEPDAPPVDWDDFERSFWAHVRRGRSPRRPRDPFAV